MFKNESPQNYSFVFCMSHHVHASVIAWLLKTKAEEKDTDGIWY
jgi:hypothetical protein